MRVLSFAATLGCFTVHGQLDLLGYTNSNTDTDMYVFFA